MFGFGILDYLKIGAGAAAGALLGWAATFAYVELVTLPQARDAGALGERIVWQERQRREAIEAQAKIDAIERDYWEKDVARAAQMSALDQALQKEKADDQNGVCAGVPAISRGVSRALNGIGRDGEDPANPDPSVPRAGGAAGSGVDGN